MNSDGFVGTWRLVSWEADGANGEKFYPFGQQAKGYICYSADGYMSVAIMAASRTPVTSENFYAASLEELAAAATTYLSYAGRYEIHAEKVVHHIEVSLMTNWIGTRQERFYELSGERLILSTPPVLAISGDMRRHYLIWERTTKTE